MFGRRREQPGEAEADAIIEAFQRLGGHLSAARRHADGAKVQQDPVDRFAQRAHGVGRAGQAVGEAATIVGAFRRLFGLRRGTPS